MKNENLVVRESGFVLVLFMFALPVLLALLGLVVDSASMYSASLKASAAAEAGVTAAVLSRIKETDTKILTDINDLSAGIDNERKYLEQRATAEAKNNLTNNGILSGNTSNNKNRAVQMEISPKGINTGVKTEYKQGVAGAFDSLTTTVRLVVPTLFMHYVNKNRIARSSGQVVQGTATINLRGANYIFVLDMSNSQSCPAGEADAGNYCRCNNAKRQLFKDSKGFWVYETCKQEADRVNDPKDPTLTGAIRIEKTRESLKNALTRLDTRRDRLSIIGFNNVAFTIIPFNPIDPATNKARPGFDILNVKSALDQLQAKHRAADPVNFANRKIVNVVARTGEIINKVPVIVPESQTNLSDGFLTAYQEAKAGGLIGTGEKYNVIYYSDGGSTAMRASFANITKPRADRFTPNNEIAPRTFAAAIAPAIVAGDTLNNYASLTKDGGGSEKWTNDLVNFHIKLGNRYDTPGHFLSAGQYKRLYLRNLMLNSDIGNAQAAIYKLGASAPLIAKINVKQYSKFYSQILLSKIPVDVYETIPERNLRVSNMMKDDTQTYQTSLIPDCFCFTATGDPGPAGRNCFKSNAYIDDAISDTDLPKRIPLFNYCFNNKALIGSYSNAKDLTASAAEKAKNTFGSNVKAGTMLPNWVSGTGNIPATGQDFRYLYYMASMEAGDLITRSGGKIHGIGYGSEASTSGPDNQNMAQGLGNVTGLKAGVMANLASAFDDLPAQYGGKTLAEIDAIFKTNNPGYQSLVDRQKNGSSGGAFYSAPTALEFEQFLNLMIIQIRMSVQSVS